MMWEFLYGAGLVLLALVTLVVLVSLVAMVLTFPKRFKARLLRWLHPELFTGAPQPHEDKSLADGESIRAARQRGVLDVGQVVLFRDGDRIALQNKTGVFWIDWRAGMAIGELARSIEADRAFRDEMHGPTGWPAPEDWPH
jgi:hypothetical protein